MVVFIANRLFLMALTMVVSSFLVFAIMEFSPGNVASKTLGPYASDESKKVLFEKLQLGDPRLPIKPLAAASRARLAKLMARLEKAR